MQFYVDTITVFIGSGPEPDPNSIQSASILTFDITDSVDRDELVLELQESLRGQPYVMQERYTQYSWGAQGSELEIAVQVAEVVGKVVGGIAGVGYIVEKVNGYASSRGWRPSQRRQRETLDQVSDQARSLLAETLNIDEDEVMVENVEKSPWGAVVTCDTPRGRYLVELRDGGEDTITKLPEE